MPWIYWGLTNLETSYTTRQRVPTLVLTIPAPSATSTLQFVVGAYLMNGSFLGYQSLTTQLLPCSASSQTTWNRPGLSVTFSCNINIYSLALSRPETIFYDLYMLNQTGGLYPVPVRNRNYRDENGNLVNSDPIPSDSNRLFRRFTWVDATSGIVNGQLAYIRIPTLIQFWMQTSGTDGMIRVPVMDITYTNRAVIDLDPLDSSVVSSPRFAFKTSWTMDYSKYYMALTVLIALGGSFSGVTAIYLSKSWGSRNVGSGDTLDINVNLN